MRRIAALLVVCFALGIVQAQEQKQKKSFKEKLIHYLDSSNVEGTDPAYIGLPEKKWAVTLNSSTDQMDLTTETHIDHINEIIDAHSIYEMGLKIKPPVATSLGFYVGYRGWGGGYSLSLSGNKGINMSFNIATPSNGINIRWRRFNFYEPQLGLYNIDIAGEKYDDVEGIATLSQAMKIESFVFDGYWIFNKKRFSLAAAYGQSVLQKRSAGSFIAGLMMYYQKFDMSQPQNVFILAKSFKGLGKLKIYQGSLGAGYTYNWVPMPGLVVNAVAMPVVSFVNYLKADNYNFTFDDDMSTEDYDEEDILNHLVSEHSSSLSKWGRVRLNLDVRASVTYWYRNWFINAMGQIHSFSSSYDETKIRMSEWDIKGAIGFTF
jgi:hypothetical protein